MSAVPIGETQNYHLDAVGRTNSIHVVRVAEGCDRVVCDVLRDRYDAYSSSATDYLLETAVVYDALAIIKQIPSQRRKLHHDSEKGVADAAMPGPRRMREPRREHGA